MSESPWNVGDVVRDRDDDEPDPAIVVNVPGTPANEWNVPRFGKTVAEDNPEYPADASVVTVLFEDNLGYSFPDWERNDAIPYDTLDEVGVQHYTFPAPRLEPAEPAQSTATADGDGDTATTDEATPSPEADETHTAASPISEADTLKEDSLAGPSAAVRTLEARLEDGGMTTEIEDDNRTIQATKLGNTYRVQPGEILDGDGPLRNRLEEIVDADDIQTAN